MKLIKEIAVCLFFDWRFKPEWGIVQNPAGSKAFVFSWLFFQVALSTAPRISIKEWKEGVKEISDKFKEEQK
jgi:hypothetical protein